MITFAVLGLGILIFLISWTFFWYWTGRRDEARTILEKFVLKR